MDADHSGFVSVKSPYNLPRTIERFTRVAQRYDLAIYDEREYQLEGVTIAVQLLFGKPSMVNYLVINCRSLAFELPLKILIWRNEEDEVFLSYDDPSSLMKRHGCPQKLQSRLTQLSCEMPFWIKEVTAVQAKDRATQQGRPPSAPAAARGAQ